MGEESGSMRPGIQNDAALPPPADDPEQIRADIVQTRAEMSETIDALQDRLSPQHLVQEAKDSVRDATVGRVKDMMTSVTDKAADLTDGVQDGAREAADYVRQNPVPAVLIGAGIAWLLMRNTGGNNRPVYSPPRRDRTAGARHTGPGVTERIQQGMQDYSRRAETQFQRWIRENPLAVGAAALAVGAAVGLSTPSTDTENAWLGETRDGLVDRAQEMAKDTVDQATQAVDGVAKAVDDMARSEPRPTPQYGARVSGGTQPPL